MISEQEGVISGSDRLLRAVAQELKLPLLHILQEAELSIIKNEDSVVGYEKIEISAEMALKLVDSYLLSTQLSVGQQSLKLEPVSISATLYDTAHDLEKLSKLYGCNLELNIQGKPSPVMADKRALKSALTSLGYAYIEAQRSLDKSANIQLSAHRAMSGGITTGIFSSDITINSQDFRQARNLYGFARQPLHSFSSSSGASIFVAGSILQAMASRLRVAQHAKMPGLAVTLFTSRQLSLIQ